MKSNENLVIKYNPKSTLQGPNTWNEQSFTHLRDIFNQWKVELFANPKKNLDIEKNSNSSKDRNRDFRSV